MTSAKRGKNVWLCSICGYWSPRAKNVERHNISIHAGAANVMRGFATLVVEPSYKITLLGPPTAPMAAHDTPMFTGAPTTATGTAKKKPFNAAELVNSNFEKYVKPIQDLQKAVNRMQWSLGMGNYGLSLPSQAVAAIPIHHTPSESAGYKGMVCDKCFAHVIVPIPFSPTPEDFKPSVEAAHSCKGERTFSSESARQQEIRQARSTMVEALFAKVKEGLKDKKIVLLCERLDGYVPQPSTVVHEVVLETTGSSTQPAVDATFMDDTKLKAFLTEVASTIGIFKITDGSKASCYYRYTIRGLPTYLPETIPADDTSNNDGKAASGPVAVTQNTRTAKKDKTEEGDKEQQQDNDEDDNTVAVALKESTGMDLANDPASKGNRSRTSGETATTTVASRPQIGGIQLAVCEECCNAYVSPITVPRDLEYEKSHHAHCPGKIEFKSEDARLEHIKGSKREKIGALFMAVKAHFQDTALYAQKIEPPDPYLKVNLTPHDGKQLGHYISRAARDVITPVDKSELLDFLACNNSSCGYYEILPSGEQYFIAAIYWDQTGEAKVAASSSSPPPPNDAEVTAAPTLTIKEGEKAVKTLDSNEK